MNIDSTISAIVTGGASGLGAATARVLAAAGARVAVVDVSEERGRAIAAEIGGTFAHCDVTNDESIDAALEVARSAQGQERILVNCAGIVAGRRMLRADRATGELQAHDAATFARVIDVNLIGTFRMVAKSALGMAKLQPLDPDGERGVIVMTSSVAAVEGQIGQAAYAASKAGIQGLTLPLARDLAQSGIRVATILPGLFETPMFDGLPDDAKTSLAAGVPFPSRLGRASEYGALVKHICENVMVNGESIRLDGAVRLTAR
ncbi:MAG: SDR family NAD(P)-dependent oxidoreductase [Hyphomicrobiaceae bacterium]